MCCNDLQIGTPKIQSQEYAAKKQSQLPFYCIQLLFFNTRSEFFMLLSLINSIIIVTLRLTLLQYHLERQ